MRQIPLKIATCLSPVLGKSRTGNGGARQNACNRFFNKILISHPHVKAHATNLKLFFESTGSSVDIVVILLLLFILSTNYLLPSVALSTVPNPVTCLVTYLVLTCSGSGERPIVVVP